MDKNSNNWLIACGILLVTACVLVLLGVLVLYLVSKPTIGV
jgi:hypothetical protein